MSFQSLATTNTFPAFGLLGFLLMVILLPMIFRVQNSISYLYKLFIMWTSLSCLLYGVNAIVWNNNTVDKSPVWCYISHPDEWPLIAATPLINASETGNPAVLLCIVRHLYRIITMSAANQSISKNRRDLIIDLCIGVVFPVVLSSLLYVVEYRKYFILENLGCFPAVAFTPLTIPLFFIWPSVLGLLNALYAGLTIRATIKRKVFRREIMQDNRYMQFDHYWRLLMLSGICIICTLPYGIVILVINLLEPMVPYTWHSIHANFSQIEQLPVSVWAIDAKNQVDIESSRWFAVFYAFIFFAFFGFTKDAVQNYRLAGLWVIRRFGFRPSNLDALMARQSSPRTDLVRREPVMFPSETSVGSLKFISYPGSNQIIASITQSLHFHPLSLPICSTDLSMGEFRSSQTGGLNGGPVTVSGSDIALSSLNQGPTRSARGDENDPPALSLPITEPVSALDASAVLRR
ncbi:hypothetical protein SERLA73DRAFT_163005 [Serpula lacrymans var. lacrymans S7.3]|uniref:Uncharacterized protein n=2 Tax=Serpula lacrymans var. lacrymans TaxID=341189 RepID=F8QB07_SERL3|nr:uncharacterized protein SERLADRAFT_411350 [Serpula lacrymans var. lacrymans S7.9]EGN94393.1 hypothetical protein SERLA73DRAFT_163005 [Serpula lacrymans var. lacrymans S7.3]EGO19876.1 hypothetical protein SERLADRAFT_411350 [Serpula lacrymans var. lacrymans S7.9]